MNLVDQIAHLHPCEEAVEWLSTQESWSAAWSSCHSGSWMLWLIGKQITSPPWSDGRKPFLACCLDCADTVKHLWPPANRQQTEDNVAVLRAWIAGQASLKQAQAARSGPHAVATDCDNGAANAAHAAVRIAAKVTDTVIYTDMAFYTADVAAYAAYAASYGNTNAAYVNSASLRARVLKQCADIVRKHYPSPPKIKQ